MMMYYWQVYSSHVHAEIQCKTLELYGLNGGFLYYSGVSVSNTKVTKTKKGRYRVRWKV